MNRLLGILIVVLAGCEEPPPPEPLPLAIETVAWTTGETADGQWMISWRPRGGPIPTVEPFVLDIKIEKGSTDVEIIVDAEMPHHGHGMNFIPEVSGGDGVFVATGLLFHMPGRWELAIDVVKDGITERAQWTVVVE